jgi:hypothetical protein
MLAGPVVTIAAQTDGVAEPRLTITLPPARTLPDIVYVCRPGPNEELRYSLRSLANLPHGKVWVFGAAPEWVTGAEVVRVPREPGAHATTKANLKAACLHPEVSEEFVYFNDDFYVMQPMERMPIKHRGTIADAMKSGMARSYTRAMKATRDILIERGIAEPLCYELHAPTLVTKQGMSEALSLATYPMVQERTLYGNLAAIGGEPARNFKVYHGDYGWKAWPFISTNDQSFERQPVGQHIRATFATPSPYETDAGPLLRPSSIRPARTLRRPVRYSATSTIRTIQRRATA